MDNLTLIDKIDQRLADSVDTTRRGHLQIQNVMDHFRKKAQAEQVQAQQKEKFARANKNGTQKAEDTDASE